MSHILIIQTASIGDVILATALAASLHNSYNDASIDFLVNANSKDLLTDNIHVDNVFAWNKKSKKYRNLFTLLKSIRAEKYDVVINLQRFASSGFITAFSKAKTKLGFSSNPFSFLFSNTIKHSLRGTHETQRNLDLANLHFKKLLLEKPSITPDFVDLNSFGINREYITISPCSLWKTKELPYTTWINFISALPDSFDIVVLGALNDKTVSEYLSANSSKSIISLVGKLSLRQSAFVMKNAVMNFSNDSAPTHIASAVNAPITTVFCSTVPDFGFYPLSDVSNIIECSDELPCRPCGIHGFKECPKNNFLCGNNIKVDQFLKILNL